MTLRLVIGVDPGVSGAVAILADGALVDVVDMPTAGRGKACRREVNAGALAAMLTEHIRQHAGADVAAAVEAVHAMPGQGVSSTYRFGEATGVVLGVLAALRVMVYRPSPVRWKRAAGLIGAGKDASRGLAAERYPTAPLGRKRDHGRADAILLAEWLIREMA